METCVNLTMEQNAVRCDFVTDGKALVARMRQRLYQTTLYSCGMVLSRPWYWLMYDFVLETAIILDCVSKKTSHL